MRYRSAISIPLLALVLASTGCVVSETRPVEYTPAKTAQVEVPVEQRLAITIVELDPGIPEAEQTAEEKIGVPADVRRAESRYIAFHMKETLEQTAQWGPVRVVPADRNGSELTMTGEIVS